MKKALFIIAAICVMACERVETVLPEVSYVDISASSKTVVAGTTFKLSAHAVPSNAADTSIAWSSSNTSVAQVNGGEVRAVAPGTSVITASSSNGMKAECVVTVVAEPVPVQGIVLNMERAEVLVDDTVRLTVTVVPENAAEPGIAWSVDREDVAIVVDGLVKGLKKGTATVTASTPDGKFKASCALTVIERVDGREDDAETEGIGNITDYIWTL